MAKNKQSWHKEGTFYTRYFNLKQYQATSETEPVILDQKEVYVNQQKVGELDLEEYELLESIQSYIVTYEVGTLGKKKGYLKIVIKEQDILNVLPVESLSPNRFKKWKVVYYGTVLFIALNLFILSWFYTDNSMVKILLGIVVGSTGYLLYDYVGEYKGEKR